MGKYCRNRDSTSPHDGVTVDECKHICGPDSQCKGFDYFPSSNKGSCYLFENIVCTIKASGSSDSIHQMKRSCKAGI